MFDIGKLGDSYFFTMEYVHGETVRNLLHRARSLRRLAVTGAVLATAGIVLFVTAPRETLTVAPTATATSAGVTLSGRF